MTTPIRAQALRIDSSCTLVIVTEYQEPLYHWNIINKPYGYKKRNERGVPAREQTDLCLA